MGRYRYSGGRLRVGGARATHADCCCNCDDCDCETEGPTANFYFEQVDDDPCTFDFFDDSDAGSADCGGTITSWEWSVGGDVFSTAQNPTNVDLETAYGAGPWDVTLTVTTECCEDAAVMEIQCFEPPGSPCCSDDPVGMLFIIEGVTESEGITCALCALIDGAYYVAGCSGSTTCFTASCNMSTRGFDLASAVIGPGTLNRPGVQLRETNTSCVGLAALQYHGGETFSTETPCKGDYTLDKISVLFGTPLCDYPATIRCIVF